MASCHPARVLRDAIRKVSRVTTNASFKDWQSELVAPLYRQARAALGHPVRMTVVQMDLMKHIYTLQYTRKEQGQEYRRASHESGQAGQRGDHALAKKRADDAWYHETVRLAATFTIRQLREIGDMASVDPDMPVIDAFVLKNLRLRLPRAGSIEGRLDGIVELHGRIRRIFSDYLDSDMGRRLVARFEETYPRRGLTRVKMLDLILWKAR